MGKLTVAFVKSAKPGRHGDGKGLCLIVKPSGGKSWVLRIQHGGKRQDIGLGSLDLSARSPEDRRESEKMSILLRRDLTLAEAREKADELRKFAKSGRDPIAERDRDRAATPDFKKAAELAHAALKDGWEAKNAAAFLSRLETHAYPLLGKVPVDEIDSGEIQDALKAIWLSKPAMARKVRQHIATVLNYAKSKSWRDSEAPSKSVSVGLPNQPEGGNFDAMPYAEVPAFVADLMSKPDTNGRLALLLVIFAPARPGEARHARWKHINFDKREWSRPAEMMKNKKAHTITLNAPAIALLKRLKDERSPKPDDLIFPGRGGSPLSDMTLTAALKTAKQPYDAHGFRSSFRDWAAEKMPAMPDPVVEAAMSHLVPDKVIRAYKRTKFIEMRRELLDAWGLYVIALQSVGLR
ncbi:tyrosine-type recombinase/integrase [Sphingomonas sp. PWP1-2]|uniref:tyrosine-type recombinase/integrase n=1 Tax=Sphingomonas sp. PWP1-2 TaxID=2804558 RepID=UPI003CF073E7